MMELCRFDPDKAEMITPCLQDPVSFWEQRVAEYAVSREEMQARHFLSRNQDTITVISIGAGTACQDEATSDSRTFCTDLPQLDLFQPESMISLRQGMNRKDGLPGFFAEHVLEHFEPSQVLRLAASAFYNLRPGGVFRVAVPDGYKPSPSYQQYIRPGLTPSGYGQAHMVSWTVDNLPVLFQRVGFQIIHKEHYDAMGDFFRSPDAYKDDTVLGKIRRSSRHDPRNQPNYDNTQDPSIANDLREGEVFFSSLWFDAVKPKDCVA